MLDSDHLSEARRSMGLEQREEGKGPRKSGRGARLNMHPSVTGPRINAESLYLLSGDTHPASPANMALASKWPVLVCAVTR